MTTTISIYAWRYWRTRLERTLTAGQMAIYDTYLERLAQTPAVPTPDERAVLDLVVADRQAAAQELEAERLVRAAMMERY